MSDALMQNLGTVQSNLQPSPNTIASDTTIAPSTFITYVTGTAQVKTITPYASGQQMIILVFTNSAPGTMLTTGNITQAIVPTQNLPTFMFYDPALGTWTGCASNLT